MFSSVFRRMADAIRGTNKPTTVLGVLRPIDTDRIARELQLDRIAAERGGENLPSSTVFRLTLSNRRRVHKQLAQLSVYTPMDTLARAQPPALCTLFTPRTLLKTHRQLRAADCGPAALGAAIVVRNFP
jgi:hypothetical protein